MQAGECYFCALPLPQSKSLVSHRKDLVHSSSTSIFLAATQGKWVWHVHGCHKTTKNGESVLNWQLPHNTIKRRQTKTLSLFCEKGVLPYLNTGFWLNTHLWAHCNPFQSPQKVDTIFAFSPNYAPDHTYLLEESLHTCLVLWFLCLVVPVFVAVTQGMTIDYSALVSSRPVFMSSVETQTVLNWLHIIPQHNRDSRLKHIVRQSMKVVYLLICIAVAWEKASN